LLACLPVQAMPTTSSTFSLPVLFLCSSYSSSFALPTLSILGHYMSWYWSNSSAAKLIAFAL